MTLLLIFSPTSWSECCMNSGLSKIDLMVLADWQKWSIGSW